MVIPRAILVLATLASAIDATSMAAQTEARVPPDSFVVVVPGIRYERHGIVGAVLGQRYRKLWTTPIRIPLLDLQRVAGGLTPVRAHTGHQTKSLRFEGADGKVYQFRSVDKDPTASLSPELQPSIAAAVLQDGVSSSMPAAALVASALLEATGVLHVDQLLAQMPDDPALGEFRAEFAGMMGMLEERPDDNDDLAISFAGARRVISPERLFERLDEGPDDRVDARAFLRARLMDMYMGDRDRHRDQFRWASTDSGDVTYWRPISRDHDEAFVKIDGPALDIIRLYFQPLITFGASYPPHDKLNWHSREIDRRLPVGLDRAVWNDEALALQQVLTDSVIEHAARAMPPEMYLRGGEALSRTLRQRRDLLVTEALSYYEFLARQVDVRGTNKPDVAELTPKGTHELEVTLRERKANAVPYFRRRFDDRETRELRLAMWGADDSVIVHGDIPPGMQVRLIGGSGHDVIVDSARTGDLRLYDHTGGVAVAAAGERRTVDTRPYPEWIGSDLDRYPPRDWGTWQRPIPWVEGNSDLGLSIGAGVLRTGYGFRKQPYASHIRARIAYATGPSTFRAELDGDFRRENRDQYWGLRLLASGVEMLHYYGQGNDTPTSGSRRFHAVRQQVYAVEPSAVIPVSPRLQLHVGPFARWSRTVEEDDRFLATVRDSLYGGGEFGQLGARAGFTYDSRDVPANAHRGVRIDGEGRLVPGAWDARRTYAVTRLVASAYHGIDLPLQPTIALRAGGQRNVGRYPFQESAFVGGQSTVRGYAAQRFAGEASAFGSAELRVTVARTQAVLPALWGGYAGTDVGRVWASGTAGGGWHQSIGGGVWMSFLDRAYSVRVGLAKSTEQSSLYVGAGLPF